jgi:hypothetical protein
LGGYSLLNRYDSLSQLISEMYPENTWLPWKHDRCPQNWWNDVKNQRKFMDWAAKELNVNEMSDWSKVTNKVRTIPTGNN